MSPAVRIVAFLGALAAVFALALGIGRVVDPLVTAKPRDHSGEHPASAAGGHEQELPGGLMVSQNGYSLAVGSTVVEPGRQSVAFEITGPDGRAVTAHERVHDKQLHLIAVRRDFAGFQHVHPLLDDGGTWRTDLDLTPGPWRIFADFKATGAEPLTLGADLWVSGSAASAPEPGEVRQTTVDGYTVTLEGDLEPAADSQLTLRVLKDEHEVEPQPYLGASGHLVALREGDLAYLHVHPEDAPGIVFTAAVPSAGRYRLFLDFKHDGVVRTAAFALTAGGGHGH